MLDGGRLRLHMDDNGNSGLAGMGFSVPNRDGPRPGGFT